MRKEEAGGRDEEQSRNGERGTTGVENGGQKQEEPVEGRQSRSGINQLPQLPKLNLIL